jgi:hypothetical protein
MDEPAQCCCIDYAVAANVVRCWQLYVGRALVTAKILNFGVERSKNVHGEQISNRYFNQILQRNSPYVPLVLKRKIWWVSANPDTKNVSGSNCVAATGAFWPKVPTIGCWGDMLPTCRQLSQPRFQLHQSSASQCKIQSCKI